MSELPSEAVTAERVDVAWHHLSELDDAPFVMLSRVMLGILVLPHSNAECERIFSAVRRNNTEFRPSMSQGLIESLAITKAAKLSQKEACFETTFNDDFLAGAKSATYKALKASTDSQEPVKEADIGQVINGNVLRMLDSSPCASSNV